MLRWDEHLVAIEFAYNSTYQNPIKTTPFQLALGYLPESFKELRLLDLGTVQREV
jgi:hypothetical protein